jgi:hypothetical protein
MEKGIYTKDNVGNGVFIFTENKQFVEPKFWGFHEENEKALCAVIVNEGNALFFYPEDVDNDTHILLEWDKEQTDEKHTSIEDGMKDTDGLCNTKALADAGSEIAQKVLALNLGGLQWYIPTLQENIAGYNNKTVVNAVLAISGKQPIKDNWYWSSTRSRDKSNFVLDWVDGYRYYNSQNDNSWVRAVSAVSLDSL